MHGCCGGCATEERGWLAQPPDSILTISLYLGRARASDRRRSPAKLLVRFGRRAGEPANHQTSQAGDGNLSFESCFILADASLQSKCRGVNLAQINKFWLLSFPRPACAWLPMRRLRFFPFSSLALDPFNGFFRVSELAARTHGIEE